MSYSGSQTAFNSIIITCSASLFKQTQHSHTDLFSQFHRAFIVIINISIINVSAASQCPASVEQNNGPYEAAVYSVSLTYQGLNPSTADASASTLYEELTLAQPTYISFQPE